MAKSKIIKELANGSVDTQTALKRAKVLIQDLENEKICDWINCELGGYRDADALPGYRVVTGVLRGSYFKGSMANHLTYTNVPLPLGKMPDEDAKKLLTAFLTMSIGALKETIETDKEGKGLVKSLPADIYPYIAYCNNDMGMMITSAYVELPMANIRNIFSIVENKLLDVLTYLEKQFGNLDDLDIDISEKSDAEMEQINSKLIYMVFNDNSVVVGDNNRIKDTEIGSSITSGSDT